MDQTTLRAELERHHRESFGWALACCRRDRGRAEAVLQESYLKVLDGRATYDGLSTFKTWLFSVIRRTAADRWRKRLLRSLRFSGELDPHQNVETDESSVDAVYRSEIQAMFARAIAALPERQREVLQLVFYHDLSLAEAADVMRITVGSARTHYTRGKERLRALLTVSGAFDEPRHAGASDQATVSTIETGR